MCLSRVSAIFVVFVFVFMNFSLEFVGWSVGSACYNERAVIIAWKLSFGGEASMFTLLYKLYKNKLNVYISTYSVHRTHSLLP